ncbi:hypothetical protein BDF14DRAFT_1857630 [Spinellus fusiger]|nr:hypothetical protein BDF14DRAFT_1857630 [Spinellus fusiger]
MVRWGEWLSMNSLVVLVHFFQCTYPIFLIHRYLIQSQSQSPTTNKHTSAYEPSFATHHQHPWVSVDVFTGDVFCTCLLLTPLPPESL